MNSQAKKTAYLIGLGGSVLAISAAIVAQHSGQSTSDVAINTTENTNVNENTNTQTNSNENLNANSNANTNTSTNLNTNGTTNANTNTATVTNTNTSHTATNTNTSTHTNVNTNTATGATGNFTGAVSFFTPGEQNRITVSVTLSNNIVTAVSTSYAATRGDSVQYQRSFDSQYKSQVIGKNISSIHLSRVGGATLTTQAFNNAITQIKAQL